MKKLQLLVGLIALFLITGYANATIIASDYTAVTQTSQDYTSGNLSAGVGPLYDSIILTVQAQGDYIPGLVTDEIITFALNGFDFFTAGANGGYVAGDPAGTLISYTEATLAADNFLMDIVLSIDPQLWFNQVTTFDGFLNVSWDNGDGVHHFNDTDHVSWNINVNAVPEPSMLALFAVGLLGLGFAGRRRSQS